VLPICADYAVEASVSACDVIFFETKDLAVRKWTTTIKILVELGMDVGFILQEYRHCAPLWRITAESDLDYDVSDGWVSLDNKSHTSFWFRMITPFRWSGPNNRISHEVSIPIRSDRNQPFIIVNVPLGATFDWLVPGRDDSCFAFIHSGHWFTKDIVHFYQEAKRKNDLPFASKFFFAFCLFLLLGRCDIHPDLHDLCRLKTH
jgi:hypothetical protein